MQRVWLIFFLIAFSSLNSEASGLRCFDLFGHTNVDALFNPNSKTQANGYAEALDAMNEKYNRFLFKENITDLLNPKIAEDDSWLTATRARFRARRIRKRLNQLHEFDGVFNPASDFDRYRLEKLAVKLEKLTFLNDNTVTQGMNPLERGEYRQAQHALLTGGLAKFLFFDKDAPPPSIQQKILKGLLTPFKDVYFRWVYSAAWMPKLDGSSIPFEVIEKVAIEGFDNNKELLKPYLAKSRARATFNLFSKAYNMIMAATIAVNIHHLAHFAYQDVYLNGIDHVVALLTPMKADAEKLAQTDFAQERFDQTLGKAIENFKETFHRDPTDSEILFLREIVKAKTQPPSHS